MPGLFSLTQISLRSAILAAATLVASESLVLAQAEPPAGGQREGRNRGEGGGRQGGQDGGGGGGMGRGFGGGGGMGRGMQDVREVLEADFQRRDIPIFVKQLNLTEDQGVVLEQLFVDYESTFQPEAEAIMTSMAEMGRNLMRSFTSPERQQQMRDTMDKIRKEIEEAEAANGPMDEETRRSFFRERMQKVTEQFANEAQASGLDAEVKAAMGEMLTKLEAWQGRKTKLRDSFVEGLKVVLDDDQISQWPAFDRFLNREKTLPRGRISGENVNLFFVVDELRLPPDQFAKVEPFFNDYETRLDNALKARNSYIEESLPRLFKSMQDGDSEAAGRIFKRQSELRVAVRDVNDEFRGNMVTALGEGEWSTQLNKAVLAAGWDRIYRPTGTERMFEEAMKLEGLDPAVLQSVAELYGAYKGEIAPINERLKNLAKTEEPARIVTDGQRFVSMMSMGVSGMARGMAAGGGENAEDPTRKVFDDRGQVGERYQERLKALLTPEQFEKLPRSRGAAGGRGNFDPNSFLDRMPEEQRKAFMDAVDKNKNGQIDDDEREGVREYMRQQFQNMRGGDGGGAGGGGGQGGGGRGRGGNGGNGGNGA
jgi:hypothetical protein